MNERIKELLKQSGLQPYYDEQEGQIEKFAELIVQECIASIQNVDGDNPDATLALVQAENAVRKHFGVK